MPIYDPDLKKRNMQKIQEVKDRIEAAGRDMNPDERALVSNLLVEIDENNKRPTREPAKWPIGDDNTRARGPFKTFGEQVHAVIDAGRPGGRSDERLHQVRAASGLSEAVPSDGGFLVQADFSSKIYGHMWQQSPILSRVRRIEVGGNGLVMPAIDETSRVDGSRFGALQSYWKAEADQLTSTKPKFREINMRLNKLTVLCYLTAEIMEDRQALESYVFDAMRQEIEFRTVDAILNGSGSGQPLGIHNAASSVLVSEESGQADDSLVVANFTKMWSRLLPGSAQNAVWLMNQDCLPQLYTLQIEGTSNSTPVFLSPKGMAGAPYGTIFGRPIVLAEQQPTLGDSGDVLLADLSNYLFIEKAGGMQAAASMHIRFDYDETALRVTFRCDGQPALASPVTPAVSSSTLSHFVRLGERTT
jgi:HK97 family phage major capsid protein